MATKKKICKQLREIAVGIEREILSTKDKYGAVREFHGVFTNPYRRLKRQYKRGEVKLNLV